MHTYIQRLNKRDSTEILELKKHVKWNTYILTLESRINVGVRLIIFEKFWRKKINLKMTAMPRLM